MNSQWTNNRIRRPVLSLVGSVSLVVANCGGSTVSPPLACGNGSEIAFAYQEYVGPGRLVPQQLVLLENGQEFLVVDQSCNYWAYYQTDHSLPWSPIRQGRLSKAQLDKLNAALIQKSWSDLASDHPADSVDGELREGNYLWLGKDVAYCPQPCESDLESLTEDAKQLTRELYEAGTPQADPAMRWQVFRAMSNEPGLHPQLFADWTGDVDLATLALDPETDPSGFQQLGFGGYRLVPGSDEAVVRGRRDQLDSQGLLASGFIGALQKGIPYQIFARDALPFEDAEGLFRPPVQ